MNQGPGMVDQTDGPAEQVSQKEDNGDEQIITESRMSREL